MPSINTSKSLETHLVALVDLRTGQEINSFPNSVAKLSEIDGKSPFFVLLSYKTLILIRSYGKKHPGRSPNRSPGLQWG